MTLGICGEREREMLRLLRTVNLGRKIMTGWFAYNTLDALCFSQEDLVRPAFPSINSFLPNNIELTIVAQ